MHVLDIDKKRRPFDQVAFLCGHVVRCWQESRLTDDTTWSGEEPSSVRVWVCIIIDYYSYPGKQERPMEMGIFSFRRLYDGQCQRHGSSSKTRTVCEKSLPLPQSRLPLVGFGGTMRKPSLMTPMRRAVHCNL